MSRTFSQLLVDQFGSDLDTDQEADTTHSVQSTESSINDDNHNEDVLFTEDGVPIQVTVSNDEYENDDEGGTIMRNPLIDDDAVEADNEFDTEEEIACDGDEDMDSFEGDRDVTRDEEYM